MRSVLAIICSILIAPAAYAQCRTTTYVINGKVIVCTTCCYGSNCTTTCT